MTKREAGSLEGPVSKQRKHEFDTGVSYASTTNVPERENDREIEDRLSMPTAVTREEREIKLPISQRNQQAPSYDIFSHCSTAVGRAENIQPRQERESKLLRRANFLVEQSKAKAQEAEDRLHTLSTEYEREKRHNEALDARIQRYENGRAELLNKHKEAAKQATSIRTEQRSQKEKLERLEDTNTAITEAMRDMRGENEDMRGKIEKLEKKCEALQNENDSVKAEVKKVREEYAAFRDVVVQALPKMVNDAVASSLANGTNPSVEKETGNDRIDDSGLGASMVSNQGSLPSTVSEQNGSQTTIGEPSDSVTAVSGREDASTSSEDHGIDNSHDELESSTKTPSQATISTLFQGGIETNHSSLSTISFDEGSHQLSPTTEPLQNHLQGDEAEAETPITGFKDDGHGFQEHDMLNGDIAPDANTPRVYFMRGDEDMVDLFDVHGGDSVDDYDPNRDFPTKARSLVTTSIDIDRQLAEILRQPNPRSQWRNSRGSGMSRGTRTPPTPHGEFHRAIISRRRESTPPPPRRIGSNLSLRPDVDEIRHALDRRHSSPYMSNLDPFSRVEGNRIMKGGTHRARPRPQTRASRTSQTSALIGNANHTPHNGGHHSSQGDDDEAEAESDDASRAQRSRGTHRNQQVHSSHRGRGGISVRFDNEARRSQRTDSSDDEDSHLEKTRTRALRSMVDDTQFSHNLMSRNMERNRYPSSADERRSLPGPSNYFTGASVDYYASDRAAQEARRRAADAHRSNAASDSD